MTGSWSSSAVADGAGLASRAPSGDKPTIGIDASRAFEPRATGTEEYSSQVIQHLVQRAHYRYRLYRRAPLPAQVAEVNVRVLRPRRLWTHLALGSELARDRPDLLFVPAHVLPLWPRLPSVVTVHDLGYLAFPEAHTAFQRWYLSWSTRRHARLATRLIADSEATRRDLQRHYGVEPERVDVVHLGVDPRLAPAAPSVVDALRARLGLPAEAPYLLHVGTLQPRKNLVRLVTAFAAATADRADVQLVLAGAGGWGHDGSVARARELGVDRRVHRVGYVARAELAPLYTGALAVLLPSLYEGFGLTALEAMACGAPVACSDGSSLPEVVGQAALLFDPLDEADMAAAIRRLVSDAPLRLRLQAAGHHRVAGFSWERCAAGTETALARALGEVGP